MPSFKYVASDSQGQRLEGVVDAPSVQEAARSLASRGLRVSQVVAAPLSPSPVAQPVAARTVVKPAPVAQPPKPAPSRAIVRTKRGSDKLNFFIFTQLAVYARSGVNPMQTAHDLSQRVMRDDYRRSLAEMAGLAREGGRISEVIAAYPDLYPAHIAGTVRVGEEVGALPLAFQRVADQAQNSHKIGLLVRWLGVLAAMVVLVAPIGYAFAKAGVSAWDVQERTGGMASGGGTLMQELGKVLLWVAPAFAGLLLVGYLVRMVWMGLSNQVMRHRAVLKVPAFGKRAKVESVASFGWALSQLARSGQSPKTSWEIAASAVPNQEVRRRLEEVGNTMGHGTRLSDALAATRLLPEEYGLIVETGEMTGGVSSSIDDANRMTEMELANLERNTRMRIGCWMVLIVVIGTAIMGGLLYGVFYRELIPKILGE